MKDRRILLIVVPRLVSYVGFLRERVAKRLFDLFLAAAALLILAPMLAALALAVRLAIGTPILFKQQRPGLRGRPFTIYKFRTMSNARDAAGGLLPDAERLGWFGKFLRSTSLDELPELINVLRGEMSIVGPRPLLMEYLPRYSAEQMRRHDVLPGITGLAQITGRNKASWPRKFELDVWYVDHRSMWLDLKIIAATLWKVLQRDGINLSHRLSAEPFMGNAEAAQSSALMIERKPTTVLVIGGENTVGQPLIKAARPMALPCRIVDTDCDKLPVEKSEAQVIQMHGRRSSGAVQTLRTSNAAEWNDVLSKMRQHDFHHLPQYHRVAEQHGEGIARLFAYSENGYTIALPLLLRLVDTNKPEGWTDATSVYGYAGPVASHEWLPESFLQTFQGTLRDELSRARVVSVFSRLHPLIPQQEMLAGLGECVENGQTISIDLSLPEEEQRAHCKNHCRRRLRELREAGFVCVHDREKRYLPELVEVYHETMRRAGAPASYFFDRMYFEMLTRELDDVSHLFVVLKDHHVAAAVICTSCGGIVQNHLGGTRDAFLKFSPSRLAVDTVRVWAKENGARVFHLGGGVGGQQDSLFDYKASFSDRRHTFFTWRWILQSDVYEEPCSEKTYRELSRQKQLSDSERGLRAISPSFFPPYRCPSEPDTVPAALRAPAPAMAPPDEIQDLKMDKPVLPRIHLSPPHMSGEELEFVKQAFASNWIAPLGPHVDAFEAEMAEYIGVSHAAALVSGTAGIHLALRLLDIQPGDEVLCSTLTFSATANPVLYEHAQPVFIDCGAASWNIDPALLREELDACARRGRLPRAVIIVDLYGESADYHEIEQACSRYDVPIIQDAAEALGATYGGRRAGGHGHVGILSFNGNKIITTSGGGMLVSNDGELIERARFLAAQARDPAPHYQHSCLGFNYRMSNVLAAIGRAQLRVLPERIAARRRNFEFYFQRLAAVPGIEFMPRQTHGSGNHWLTCITIDPSEFGATREEVRLMLEAHNIEARPVWKPLHMQPVFAGCRVRGGERSAAVFERGLCLPSGSNLSRADLERISTLILAARKSVAATAL